MSAEGARLRILLIAYYYPPRAIIGARRPSMLAKHLRRRGHEVTVVTSALNRAPGDGNGDGEHHLPARDLLATRLNWRREHTLGAGGAGASEPTTWTPGPGLWGSIFVPDVQLLSWAPFALATGLREVRRSRPDVVLTTSPVESAHLVGHWIQRLTGVPWVADLRDGWRFEAPRDEWPTALQRRCDDLLERVTVRAARAVVTVSEPLSGDLRKRHRVAVETIPNGFDPDDAPGDPPPGLVSSDRFTLVHTGGLGHERTLEPVLEAMATLAGEHSTEGRQLELVAVGQQTEHERELYASPRWSRAVRAPGVLPRTQALAVQRAADLLVLVTSGVRTGEATGKLFEYLAADRPILVLGDDSEAARIVEAAGAGWAVPVRDADAAAAMLRRILAGERPPPATGAPREAYAYPALAARYAELLERVAAAR